MARNKAIIDLTNQQVSSFVEAATSQQPILGSTHNYYRYPARFSPEFARAALDCWTSPDDLVMDPFVGGGTTLVEAALSGRRGLGIDISSLATFITGVKTTRLAPKDLVALEEWLELTLTLLNVRTQTVRTDDPIVRHYQRNLDGPETWRLRKLLEVIDNRACELRIRSQQSFARCVALKVGQWALDGRRRLPSTQEFRARFATTFTSMLGDARAFRDVVSDSKITCLNRSIVGAEKIKSIRNLGRPKLVLTSPPYPGVYVTYHRWKVLGRRETAAPFWIAQCRDGAGLSHYTLGGRLQKDLLGYWLNLSASFTSIRALCDLNTIIVQLVGFSKPEVQLPQYLKTMQDAGFEESYLPNQQSPDGRVWRPVPGRRWYAAYQQSTAQTSREVVLFHRPSTPPYRP